MIRWDEIAKITGYSQSTISKAINGYSDISEKTRKKILEAAEELGYVPNASAQNLVKKKSKTIGVVFDVGAGLKNIFFTSILESFRKYVEEKGYDLLFLSNYTENGMDYLKHCRAKQVDAVLIVAGDFYEDSIHRLMNSEVSYLVFDPKVEIDGLISSDGYEGITKSLEYLYELGHRRLAYIHGGKDTYVGNQRIRAYLDFINRNNLTEIWIDDLINFNFDFDEGFETMKRILDEYGLPDAVCCGSDLMAIGAIKYLKDNGYSIPDDISVTGFDDLQICEIVTPKLTTVRQDFEKIGNEAGKLLIHNIESNTQQKEKIVIPTALVIRESCKKNKLKTEYQQI